MSDNGDKEGVELITGESVANHFERRIKNIAESHDFKRVKVYTTFDPNMRLNTRVWETKVTFSKYDGMSFFITEVNKSIRERLRGLYGSVEVLMSSPIGTVGPRFTIRGDFDDE